MGARLGAGLLVGGAPRGRRDFAGPADSSSSTLRLQLSLPRFLVKLRGFGAIPAASWSTTLVLHPPIGLCFLAFKGFIEVCHSSFLLLNPHFY